MTRLVKEIIQWGLDIVPVKTCVETLIGTKGLWWSKVLRMVQQLGWCSSTAVSMADPVPGGWWTRRLREGIPTAHPHAGAAWAAFLPEIQEKNP